MQTKSTTNILGIDVSHHNGTIDWNKVKSAGVKFAFIKSSEGVNYTDSTLNFNAKEARSVGIKIGFYHYARPEKGNNPLDEATYFIRQTKQYTVDLPYVLDVEGTASALGADKLTSWCNSFLNKVKELTGKSAIVYTGASFAKSYLGKELGVYPLWVAHYGVNTPMANPTWSQWSVFQYTSSGTVQGIPSRVDMNVMEKAYFDKLTKSPVAPKPVPVPTEKDKIKVVVNDVLVAYGRILEDNHCYLPLRKCGEALDKEVYWDNSKKLAYVDGKLVKNIRLIDNVCFAQLREAAELFGAFVSFENGTKKVYIYN